MPRIQPINPASAIGDTELWAFGESRIAVRFEYEWHDAVGQWFRSCGNEMCEFDARGLMARRYSSINDAPIRVEDRRIFAPAAAVAGS